MSFRKRGSAKINLTFKGTNELSVRLKKAADMELVKQAVLLNGSEMQQKAQRIAPVDTGHLKRGIGLSSDLADRGFSVRVYSNADYSGYLEWGTRYMFAQPFMRPSFNEQKKQFKKDLQRLMK